MIEDMTPALRLTFLVMRQALANNTVTEDRFSGTSVFQYTVGVSDLTVVVTKTRDGSTYTCWPDNSAWLIEIEMGVVDTTHKITGDMTQFERDLVMITLDASQA